MVNEDKISIFLNKEEAELFKLFREVQDDFKRFYNAGLFNFRNGEGKITRNENGIISGIFVNLKMYDAKKDKEKRTILVSKLGMMAP